MPNAPRAIIIGAGPAGLTAAYELLDRTSIHPLVLEKSEYMGGIARTVSYKGNRIDLGGHRFFSKSSRVTGWWLNFLPLEAGANGPQSIHYRGAGVAVQPKAPGPDPRETDLVMLVRQRRSRIYHLRKFFDYPIRLSARTVVNLGAARTLRIGASYLRSALFPIRPETNLEEFLVNRFGRELYRTFFQSYTEKVWGVPCKEIGAEWGAQRVQGLSVWRTLRHAADKLWRRDGNQPGRVETSLIEQFLYPKLGPGQMWDEVARRVRLKGGEIRTGWAVTSVVTEGSRVRGIVARNPAGRDEFIPGEYVFSTAPVQELIRGFRPEPPQDVRRVAEGLVYRDFIMVGLLVRRLKVAEASGPGLIQDNWIYIQEPDVLLGRLQIFNNWSPYLVADSGKVWLGLEYFCNQGDALWRRSDQDLVALGRSELARIGILDQSDVEDGTVLRMEKTYPAYLGEYRNFHRVREFLDRFPNLFPLGRNGMHRYNNQDHSMLTAMVAVDNIVRGVAGKSNLWEINTEQEYLEQTAPRTRAATAG